jgi:hypothetical protein
MDKAYGDANRHIFAVFVAITLEISEILSGILKLRNVFERKFIFGISL